jgi:hypothetical protein
MNPFKKSALAVLAAGLVACGSAVATPFHFDFTNTNFQPLGGSDAAPQTTVTGWIEFTAASYGASIDQITAVNLTIDGFTYAVSDVGGLALGDGYLFGGLNNGVNGMGGLTNDFWAYSVDYTLSTAYTSANHNGGWESLTGIHSTFAVPEPASGVLMLGAIGAMALVRRRRQPK